MSPRTEKSSHCWFQRIENVNGIRQTLYTSVADFVPYCCRGAMLDFFVRQDSIFSVASSGI